MSPEGLKPKISVVIPTYNRDEMLRETLLQLTRQSLPAGEFEVIVADDGSTDETKAVVDSFSGQLQMGYHFQENLGFRAGTARNAGARLASAPVLCFIDTGVLPGPDFLTGHLAEHDETGHAAVVGYCYGYNPVSDPLKTAADMLRVLPPALVIERFGEDAAFRDMRHEQFLRCGFDLSTRAIPWNLFYTANCSVRTDDFWAAGGFDESFVGWGGEDVELAFRLYRRGLTFRISQAGWVIEWPHERPHISVLKKQLRANLERCVRKTPEPVMEIGAALSGTKIPLFKSDELYRELTEWTGKARGLAVTGEIAVASRGVPAGGRMAIMGCGGVLPLSLPHAIVMDFDRGLLDQAVAGGRHTGYNSIGLCTPLDDSSVDAVIITSRLSGLWERWGDLVTREAERVGEKVIRMFDDL